MELNGQLLSAVSTLIISLLASLLLSRSTTKAAKSQTIGKALEKLAAVAMEKAKEDQPKPADDELPPGFAMMLQMVEKTVANNMHVAQQSIDLLEEKAAFRQEQIEVMKGDYESLLAQQRHLETLLAKVNADVKTYAGFRDADRLEIDKLNRQMNDLAGKLNEANRLLQTTTEELKQERARLTHEQRMNSILRTERDHAVAESAENEAKRRELENDYRLLQTELREVRAELKEVRQQLEILQSVTVPRSQVDRIEQDLKHLGDTGKLADNGKLGG